MQAPPNPLNEGEQFSQILFLPIKSQTHRVYAIRWTGKPCPTHRVCVIRWIDEYNSQQI